MSARQGITVKKSKSRSRRAGLLFPVGRIHRLCRKGPWVGSRISAGAPVYLAAVMEYLTAELLEQAGLVARYGSSTRISPRHIKKAVKTDEELDKLCEGVVMVGGDDEELEIETSLRLLKADMAGDLRGPTHGSLVGNRGAQQKKSNKRKMFKITKMLSKNTAVAVDSSEDEFRYEHEKVIDLTSNKKKMFKIPKMTPKDSSVVVDISEDESRYDHEQVSDMTNNKKKMYKIPKMTPKDSAVVVDISEDESRYDHEQVIDLTYDNLMDKKVKMVEVKNMITKKRSKDINGNNILVDLTEDDRSMVDDQFRKGQAKKKGFDEDSAKHQVVEISKTLLVGKSNGKQSKPLSFDAEMIKADLRLDKIYKNKKDGRVIPMDR